MADHKNSKVPQQSEKLTQTLAALIAGYDGIVNLCGQGTTEKKQQDLARLKELLDGFHKTRSSWEREQVTRAEEFNLLQVMGVADDEVTHSRILAWMLDQRLEHGTHAQGNLGFRLFIQELGPKLKPQSADISSYHNKSYWVQCEVSGIEARVDIEIAAMRRFIIHIENKIGSFEGDDQTNREWRDLQRRAKELGISGLNTHAIFLTIDGSDAKNDNFVSIPWRNLLPVLEGFAEQAQAVEVKLFAAHYAKAISKLTPTEPETEENENEDSAV
jgi:hypothetical protein